MKEIHPQACNSEDLTCYNYSTAHCTQRSGRQRFWLVDPLDGTKDFIARNDEFTVNIALIENGIPMIGVVAAQALKRTWYASSGAGAWQDHADAKSFACRVSDHIKPL